MTKKSRQRKGAKQTPDGSDDLYRCISSLSAQFSSFGMSDQADRLWARVHISKSASDQARLYRDLIGTTQTDILQNDNDPYGDGDQRRLPSESQCQVFRNIWTVGGDLEHLFSPDPMSPSARGFSPFALACATGNKKLVETLLKVCSEADTNRTQFLECRESAMRVSPLLIAIALAKHPGTVHAHTQYPKDEMDFAGVAKVLLQYGARPDVKDVAGKNATHYGAGSHATEVTLKIAEMCIEASKTCRYYGKVVTVKGLANEEYNGLEGKLGGYLVDHNRRTVYLQVPSPASNEMGTKELAIRPANIYFEDVPILDESYKLIDIPDRLGAVPLHEVVMSDRVDVARFLCEVHQASLDIPDVSGSTPRKMAVGVPGLLINATMETIRNYGIKTQDKSCVCHKCGMMTTDGSNAEQTENKFKRCGRCGQVYYCSKECQVADWPSHRRNGCVDNSKGVVLQDPQKANLTNPHMRAIRENCQNRLLVTAGRSGTFANGTYRKPDRVGVGEKFWVKIQVGEGNPHLVYDQSRQCSFYYFPGQPGFDELSRKVLAEPVSMGRKCHFQASFSVDGNCTVFPSTAKLLEW